MFVDSWWSKPATGVPLSPRDSQYRAWVKAHESNGLGLGVGDWAMPDHVSDGTEPLATCTGKVNGTLTTVQVHIPSDLPQMGGNDKACDIVDPTVGLNVQMFETVKVSDTQYTCTGMAVYRLDSNGIAYEAGGVPGGLGNGPVGNAGHRGVPGAVHCVRLKDIAAGLIPYRVKFALSGPGEPGMYGLGTAPIWPMEGYEKGHGDGPPEGVVMRLKSSAVAKVPAGPARVVAQALATYGALLGDTGGHATVKVEAASSYPAGLTARALSPLSWDDFEWLVEGWR
jgi:hypothetical protein